VSAAAPCQAATRRRGRRSAAIIVATCVAAAAMAGCARATPDPPSAPPRSPLYSEPATARNAARADELDAGAGVTVTAPAGSAGRGALARRLPLRFRRWRLSLAQISARPGVYVVTMLPPPGRPVTPTGAARLLRAAAHAFGDDPGAYRPLVAMSALAGAHHHRGRDDR
jgi:hypothetical protein